METRLSHTVTHTLSHTHAHTHTQYIHTYTLTHEGILWMLLSSQKSHFLLAVSLAFSVPEMSCCLWEAISNCRSHQYLAHIPALLWVQWPLYSLSICHSVSLHLYSLCLLLSLYLPLSLSLLLSSLSSSVLLSSPLSPFLSVFLSPSGEPSNLHQEQTRLLDIQFPACHALLYCMCFSSFSWILFVWAE